MGDVVLKLDADAARYVSEIVKAAEKSKDLGKGAKEAKDYYTQAADVIEQAGAKLGKAATLGGILASTGAAVYLGYKEWIEALARGEKSAAAIVDSLRRAAAQSSDLKNLGDVREQILNMESPLNLGQRVSAYGAFRQAAPRASSGAAVNAVRAASAADVAGLDATQFARNYGKLYGGFGEQSGDAAAFLMQRGGEQGGAAIDQLSSMAAVLGGDQARNSLPIISAASRTPGGLGVISPLMDSFIKRGSHGSFSDYVANAKRGQVSDEQLPLLRALQGQLAGEQGAAGNLRGYLGEQTRAVLQNPIDLTRTTTRVIDAQTEADDYRLRGEKASNRELGKALNRNFSTNTNLGAQFSFVPSLLRDFDIIPDADVYRKQTAIAGGASGPAARGPDAYGPGFSDLTISVEEQTAELRRQTSLMSRPAIGTQGEGGN